MEMDRGSTDYLSGLMDVPPRTETIIVGHLSYGWVFFLVMEPNGDVWRFRRKLY